MATRFPWKTMATGVAGLALGLVIATIGYVVLGRMDGTAWNVAAGTVAVLGITVSLLSVFLLMLPPLLPSR